MAKGLKLVAVYQVVFVSPFSIDNKLVLKSTLQRQLQSRGVTSPLPGMGEWVSDWNGTGTETHILCMGTGCQLEKVPATQTWLLVFHSRLSVLVFSTLL